MALIAQQARVYAPRTISSSPVFNGTFPPLTLINNTKIFNNKNIFATEFKLRERKKKVNENGIKETCFRFDKTACFCFLLAITYLLPLRLSISVI